MNPQPVKYKDVEDLMCHLPQDELSIVEQIRNVISEFFPQLNEKLSYNVPSYYLEKKKLIFIWPASIPWGGNIKGVSVCFVNGNMLEDIWNLLETKNRKTIRSIDFEKKLIEREIDAVISFIDQSIQLHIGK